MGIYLVRLTVKMAGTQVFGFSEGYIRAIESPLVAHIAGGTKVERGFNKTLVFNASLSRDPDSFHPPHGKLTTLLFTDYGKISCQQTICSLRSGIRSFFFFVESFSFSHFHFAGFLFPC